jgi:hypothetical protein
MQIKIIKDTRLEGSINLMVDLVAEENKQFVVERKGKPVAWLIPKKMMQIIERIIEENPLLADELVMEVDGNISNRIQASRVEAKQGQTIPLDVAFAEQIWDIPFIRLHLVSAVSAR